MDFEIITFPRVLATLEIVPLLIAIKYWLELSICCWQLLLLIVGKFYKILVWIPKQYMRRSSHCFSPLLWAVGMLWWAIYIIYVVVKGPWTFIWLLFIKPFLIFWFCFIYTIRFGFLFFMLADLLQFVINFRSLLISWSSFNSIQVESNAKVVNTHEDICFS
jgi:hypothetical protein